MFLLKYLQNKYGLSRRKLTNLIKERKILLNGEVVESFKIELSDADSYQVEYDDKKINGTYKKDITQKTMLVLFNKPKGYVVSHKDSYNKTIYDILDSYFEHKLYYIGRLDKDSHGLLLLTNNSELVNIFSHPKYNIEKRYIVRSNKQLSDIDILKFKKGIIDEGELLVTKNISNISPYIYQITLLEGKKRHIRRMFKSVGAKVVDLQRVQEGKYKLGDIKKGEWKIIYLEQDNLLQKG